MKLASVDVAPSISKLVILNLFQDPSGGTDRSPRPLRFAFQRRSERAVPRSGRTEKWTLKRVQGDGGFKNKATIQLLHGTCESRLKMEIVK